MRSLNNKGWKTFLEGFPWFHGEDRYSLQAYSEFMPPLQTGLSPFDGSLYPWVFSAEDPFGWLVDEMEEEYQLRPGIQQIGLQVLKHIVQLGTGELTPNLAGHNQRNLRNNLFWPEELAAHKGHLKHEKYVSFLPLSLSKTKDDKGRVRWTLFGASEQGPEKAFWKSFFESPFKEKSFDHFLALMNWIFQTAYWIHVTSAGELYNLGFRILPSGDYFPFDYWKMKTLPSWAGQFLLKEDDPIDDVNYILTFRPFGKLPAAIKAKYLIGKLALFPFPGSMVHMGIPEYINLQKTIYNAIQISMLRLVNRHEQNTGIRIPQSGWLHQPKTLGEKAEILEEFIVNNYVRTNRWNKFHRNEDALLKSNEISPVIQTLFSTTSESLDLYNKPMARNCQLLTENFELLLNGPKADRLQIGNAALRLLLGGLFRYRFYFPPMQVGKHEIFWQRPLVACLSKDKQELKIDSDLITGYMTGYETDRPDPGKPVELWPKILRREINLSMLNNFLPHHDHYQHQTSLNLMALMDTLALTGKEKLNRDFARQLVRIPNDQKLEEWLETFPARSIDPEKAKMIVEHIESLLEPADKQITVPEPLTLNFTANRDYEKAYWNEIFFLAHGEFINKDNADVVQELVTQKYAVHPDRDLHRLGDYFIKRYRQSISATGMDLLAEVGELPFRWETDFEYTLYGGWNANQEGKEYERNILVIIPGKNREEAVIMADHYDTAFMADVFDTTSGGLGARLSAAGADDNYSASATLLLAAPVYLKMAKEGKLENDVWLLHLTGEEFPSDCMGARDFCKNYIQKTLKMKREDGTIKDLSSVKVKGVLVMDMIAHNNDSDRNCFQISPGKSLGSLELAMQAHKANRAWNGYAARLNELPERKRLGHGQRSQDGKTIPSEALHLLPQGEIRTWEDPHSTLYNTDGIIFSDSGIPVILFMENYDINRQGYHDTHDTMENIDLDYGAAISSIAIETIARIATNLP